MSEISIKSYKIRPNNSEGFTKAFANVKLNNGLAINGIGINTWEGRLYIRMPQEKLDEEYRDLVSVDKELHNRMQKVLVEGYKNGKFNELTEISGTDSEALTVTNVELDGIRSKGMVKSVADVQFNGSVVVHGIRVKEANDKTFVTMPQSSYMAEDGTIKYSDRVFPTTKEGHEAVSGAVMNEYKKQLENKAEQKQSAQSEVKREQQSTVSESKIPPAAGYAQNSFIEQKMQDQNMISFPDNKCFSQCGIRIDNNRIKLAFNSNGDLSLYGVGKDVTGNKHLVGFKVETGLWDGKLENVGYAVDWEHPTEIDNHPQEMKALGMEI